MNGLIEAYCVVKACWARSNVELEESEWPKALG